MIVLNMLPNSLQCSVIYILVGKRDTNLEGIIVILLVFLTGVGSLLAAPECLLLLLLELSADTLLLVDVEFLRDTGFRSGFTGPASCASGAVKVRMNIQTLAVLLS